MEREDVCPVVTLPDDADMDGYLSTLGKKERHEIRRKVRRAVSSTEGIANLTEILVSCTGKDPEDYTSRFADLKNVVAEAVIEELRPVRDRTLELELRFKAR